MSERVIESARSWIGTPFRSQARVKGAGVDCVQMLAAIYQEVCGKPLPLPHYRANSIWEHRGEEKLDNLLMRSCELIGSRWRDVRAGDILTFRYGKGLVATHAAIVAGRDAMIHAEAGCGVRETPMLTHYWIPRLSRIFRIEGEG